MLCSLLCFYFLGSRFSSYTNLFQEGSYESSSSPLRNSILGPGASYKCFNTDMNTRGRRVLLPKIFSSIFLKCILLRRVLSATGLFPFAVSKIKFSRSTLIVVNTLSLILFCPNILLFWLTRSFASFLQLLMGDQVARNGDSDFGPRNISLNMLKVIRYLIIPLRIPIRI